MTIRLLGRVSSINVRKVLWALGEIGQPYEREDWGLPLRDPKAPEFLALNPNAQVPVLIEGEFVLWESNAILLYLAERHGRGTLWTEDAQARALAYQWLGWQASELNPAWSYAVSALVRQIPGFDDPAQIAQSMARWTAKMTLLDTELGKTGRYVAGDRFTIADIAIGLSVHRWMRTPYNKAALPAVTAYYQRLRARPAGAEWLSDATP